VDAVVSGRGRLGQYIHRSGPRLRAIFAPGAAAACCKLVLRCRFGSHGCGVRRKRHDDFARTSVVQFFAGLVLYRVGVSLQTVYMAAQIVIFALQVLYFGGEIARILALLSVGDQPIVAKDDVVPDGHGENGRGHRSSAPSLPVQPPPCRTQAVGTARRRSRTAHNLHRLFYRRGTVAASSSSSMHPQVEPRWKLRPGSTQPFASALGYPAINKPAINKPWPGTGTKMAALGILTRAK
jgi:hypothetical protein